MARSINQVILMGRLTRDPEQRTTTTGKNIASFSIAVDRGGQDDQADFFDITAWERLADLVMQYLSKGRRVLVQGRRHVLADREVGEQCALLEEHAPAALAALGAGGPPTRLQHDVGMSGARPIEAVRLPSTSPANASWSFERKLTAWADVMARHGLL